MYVCVCVYMHVCVCVTVLRNSHMHIAVHNEVVLNNTYMNAHTYIYTCTRTKLDVHVDAYSQSYTHVCMHAYT